MSSIILPSCDKEDSLKVAASVSYGTVTPNENLTKHKGETGILVHYPCCFYPHTRFQGLVAFVSLNISCLCCGLGKPDSHLYSYNTHIYTHNNGLSSEKKFLGKAQNSMLLFLISNRFLFLILF